MVFSVRPSVCPSVTPFWLCSHHRIIIKFSGVITRDQGKVHAKGQGQRSKVKVTEDTTQLNRFRTVTPVWIHIWWWNDTYSLMLLRRGHVAWEWWEFRWSNKWNWYSSGLNASILVWHTCASALSGWVLYRQLELTKLTRPDLHHVVGLFILKDVCPSVCLSQLFDYVPIIVSSWNFQELLPMTKVRSMQKVKVRGQRSRSQRSTPSLEEVPYCFSRSFVKFQGHTALKIVEFDPDWAFLDCNSSLNSPMAKKWCTKLEVALKRCPIVFQGHPSNLKVTRL